MSLPRVLFYLDGNSIPKVGAFTRSGAVGKYTDVDGLLKDAAANEYRRDWRWSDSSLWLPDTPTLIIERAATNLNNEDDLTAWTVASGASVATGSVSDPGGGTGAYKLEDDDGSTVERIDRIVTFTGNGTKAFVAAVREGASAPGITSFYIFDNTAPATRMQLRVTGWSSGVPTVDAAAGAYLGKRYVGNGYWALYALASGVIAANANEIQIAPAQTDVADTGDIDVYRVNAYNLGTPPLSILDASETLGAETAYFPFPHEPQPLTVYAKFIEWGSAGITNARILTISGPTNEAGPRLTLYNNGTKWIFFHENENDQDTSEITSPESFGEVVELRGVLSLDGSVELFKTVDGGTETSAGASGALEGGLPAAWSAQRIYLGSSSFADIQGVLRLLEVKVVSGAQTLAYMQSVQPAFALGGLAIPVESGSVRGQRIEMGDRARTFDGTFREVVRARKSGWTATTAPVPVADRNLIVAQLESSTQPQTAFGDMLRQEDGTVPTVFTRVTGEQIIQSGTNRWYRIDFAVDES